MLPENVNLKDLGCSAHPFTWSNERFGSAILLKNDWMNFCIAKMS